MGLTSARFEEMFKTHYTMLCNVCNSIVRDRDAAEDIVQELFATVWKRRDELDTTGNFKGYLLRSVSNASLNYLQNNKRITTLSDTVPAQQTNIGDGLTTEELKNKIRASLNKLPGKCRAIFVMSRFHGMKYREIADCLGISVKTVENQMGIALEKMRNELKPYLTREFMSMGSNAVALTVIMTFLEFI